MTELKHEQFPATLYITYEEDGDDGFLLTHSTAENAVALGETKVVAAYTRARLFSGTLVAQLHTQEIT